MNGVTTPFDKPVLSEPLPLRQAQGERLLEGLRANGDKLTGQYWGGIFRRICLINYGLLSNNQIPSTNHQIITNTSMTEILK